MSRDSAHGRPVECEVPSFGHPKSAGGQAHLPSATIATPEERDARA